MPFWAAIIIRASSGAYNQLGAPMEEEMEDVLFYITFQISWTQNISLFREHLVLINWLLNPFRLKIISKINSANIFTKGCESFHTAHSRFDVAFQRLYFFLSQYFCGVSTVVCVASSESKGL